MKRTKFEDVLDMVGDKGKWQYVTTLFTWLEGIIIGCHHLSSVFLGYSPAHWCNTDHLDFPASWTEDEIKNYSIPLDPKGKWGYETCSMYNINGTVIPEDFNTAILERPQDVVTCDKFKYDMSMGQTIVVEWDLVCNRLALLSTVQGSYMGGVFVGCIFWGWASDKFGRRLSILLSVVIQIISCFAAAISYNYIMFIFFRFFVAFSVSGVFECGFVLVTEIVSKELRTPFGIMTQFPFGIGASVLPLVAYFVRDWVPLQLAISVPALTLISYYWFIPESPRWLISVGRNKDALEVLKKAAKTNGKVLPSDEEMMAMLDSIEVMTEEESHDKTSKEVLEEIFKEIVTLVKTPEMRRRTINVFFSWLVVAMVYYGLSFNTKNIGGNIYVSNLISGMAEVVACLLIIPALSRFGRVKVYSGTFLLGGIACVAVAIILWSTEQGTLVWLVITLAMIGKFLIAGTFALAYLYTAELFPTPVRNVAVGGASTFARIGSISAPYIVDILGKVSAGIPVVIFGGFSILAGIFAVFLPETLNRKLPETVADVEEYGLLKKNKGKTQDPNELENLTQGTC